MIQKSLWIVRIEYRNQRAKHALRKTEKGAVAYAKKLLSKKDSDIINCRVFKEVGTVRQLSIFEMEAEY